MQARLGKQQGQSLEQALLLAVLVILLGLRAAGSRLRTGYATFASVSYASRTDRPIDGTVRDACTS